MLLIRLLPKLPREICLAVIGLIGGVFLAGHGIVQAHAELTGMPGTVQVTGCHRATGAWSDLWEDGWSCDGSFESDDHSVRIAAVGIDGIMASPPDKPLAARVAGASADTVTQDSSGRWKWPALTGVVVLAFTAWRIRSVRGLLRERRADGAGSPVPA
ncbi:hypothetical protein [Streptomyces sp. TLI_185]|uniref:hypothetical protein n=1 Tax=Streptomyces sp. TLI_185 TaxID=2485151 RepID=UPI000F506E36|nr:hypothetical protein [Streptomyces sp. TLI_185]RPF33902.1 hypothetical protein EDD92_3835 [Streptomyces sp. TLI_185]